MPNMRKDKPEAENVGRAIQQYLDENELTRAELADRIEALTGQRPSDMWMSRALSGINHLTHVREVRVTEVTSEPNEKLLTIARALQPNRYQQLAREFASHVNDDEVTHTASVTTTDADGQERTVTFAS